MKISSQLPFSLLLSVLLINKISKMKFPVASLLLLLLVIFKLQLQGAAARVAIEASALVDSMNAVRRRVPDGANLQELEWNVELATLAQSHADNCSLKENVNRETSSLVPAEIGENINVTARVANSRVFVRDTIEYWESLGDLYEFETNVFINNRAALYSQLVWAGTSQVGCGLSVCEVKDVEYHFLVCDFQPSGNDYGKRPYTRGVPCSQCPRDKSLCRDKLCAPELSTTTGFEPHFGIELLSGQILCFSAQGQSGSSINLLSTHYLEIYASFVQQHPHAYSHNSLVAIEIVNGGRQLVINATSSEVCIDHQVNLEFRSVQKVVMMGNKLSLSMVNELITSSDELEVRVDGFNFTFFITNQHMDVMVSYSGPDQHFNGLLGELLRSGVSINEVKKELRLGRHRTLPVEQRLLSSFIHAHSTRYEESTCWTTVEARSHSVGNLFSEFLFGSANQTTS